MLWEDGKGSGRKAGVDVRNFGQVSAVVLTDETFVALNDNTAFAVDTAVLDVPASFDGPVLTLENLDGSRDILTRLILAIDTPSDGAALSLLRKPIEGALANNTAKTPLNRNFESGKGANVNSWIWDGVGTAGITGFTAVPDGTFGPFVLGDTQFRTGVFILGQNDIVAVALVSGAAGYKVSVSLSFHFDSSGAK